MNNASSATPNEPSAIEPGADQQHEPETHVCRAPTERLDSFVEHAVAHRGDATHVDQCLQPSQDRRDGVVDPHRRGAGHHVADEPRDVARRGAIGRSSCLDPRVEHPGEGGDREQRGDEHRSGAGVGRSQHERGDDRERHSAGHVDHAVDELCDVLGVVAEVCDRLAGRCDGPSRLGAAARHLGGEQVGAEERLHVHPATREHDGAGVDHRHPCGLDGDERHDPAHDRARVLPLERVERLGEDPPDRRRKREEHDEQQPAEPEGSTMVLADAP